MSSIKQIFVGQPYTLRLYTGDLTGATGFRIRYFKPGTNDSALWTDANGVAQGSDEWAQFVILNLTGAMNDTDGEWRFQAEVNFGSGWVPGHTVKGHIFSSGADPSNSFPEFDYTPYLVP